MINFDSLTISSRACCEHQRRWIPPLGAVMCGMISCQSPEWTLFWFSLKCLSQWTCQTDDLPASPCDFRITAFCMWCLLFVCDSFCVRQPNRAFKFHFMSNSLQRASVITVKYSFELQVLCNSLWRYMMSGTWIHTHTHTHTHDDMTENMPYQLWQLVIRAQPHWYRTLSASGKKGKPATSQSSNPVSYNKFAADISVFTRAPHLNLDGLDPFN